jgi:hypothetical protein
VRWYSTYFTGKITFQEYNFIVELCAGSEERISNGSVAALTGGELEKTSRSPDKQLPLPDSPPDISKVHVRSRIN